MKPASWIRLQADRLVAALLVVAGIVSLLVGWIQASDAVLASQQIPYVVSGGLFGLLLTGVGSVVWLSADLRDEWRAIKRVEDRLSDLQANGSRTEPAK